MVPESRKELGHGPWTWIDLGGWAGRCLGREVPSPWRIPWVPRATQTGFVVSARAFGFEEMTLVIEISSLLLP